MMSKLTPEFIIRHELQSAQDFRVKAQNAKYMGEIALHVEYLEVAAIAEQQASRIALQNGIEMEMIL